MYAKTRGKGVDQIKLYILNAVKEIPYDSYDSFVVRAPNERKARDYAHDARSNESYQYNNFWLDSEYSSCEVLTVAGEPGVIASSYNAG